MFFETRIYKGFIRLEVKIASFNACRRLCNSHSAKPPPRHLYVSREHHLNLALGRILCILRGYQRALMNADERNGRRRRSDGRTDDCTNKNVKLCVLSLPFVPAALGTIHKRLPQISDPPPPIVYISLLFICKTGNFPSPFLSADGIYG